MTHKIFTELYFVFFFIIPKINISWFSPSFYFNYVLGWMHFVFRKYVAFRNIDNFCLKLIKTYIISMKRLEIK